MKITLTQVSIGKPTTNKKGFIDMIIHATMSNFIELEILPALGEHTTDFDIAYIADELAIWVDVCEENTEFGTVRHPAGYALDQSKDFWEVVKKHAS